MSASRYLFGDFPVAFQTPLPVSAAAGRLAAISDQSTFHGREPQLHGYATTNEVILWEGSDMIINPFRPYFRGSFSQEQDSTILSGTIHAHWITKFWCAGVAAGSLVSLAIGSAAPADNLLLLAIAATALSLLHLSIRPGSKLTRSLTAKIESAVNGEGANNSFKPKPLRGSA